MTATVPIPFALGQEVWWVGNGCREEWVMCPDCAGTRVITMILGNGEQVSLHCEVCRRGYDLPSGTVKRTFYEHRPERFTPYRVSVDGDEVRYSESDPSATCYRVTHAKDLFTTEEECAARCEELNRELTKYEEERAVANLKSKRRDMAWSVCYWREKVAHLEKDLAAAKARLAVCKEKAKTKED